MYLKSNIIYQIPVPKVTIFGEKNEYFVNRYPSTERVTKEQKRLWYF